MAPILCLKWHKFCYFGRTPLEFHYETSKILCQVRQTTKISGGGPMLPPTDCNVPCPAIPYLGRRSRPDAWNASCLSGMVTFLAPPPPTYQTLGGEGGGGKCSLALGPRGWVRCEWSKKCIWAVRGCTSVQKAGLNAFQEKKCMHIENWLCTSCTIMQWCTTLHLACYVTFADLINSRAGSFTVGTINNVHGHQSVVEEWHSLAIYYSRGFRSFSRVTRHILTCLFLVYFGPILATYWWTYSCLILDFFSLIYGLIFTYIWSYFCVVKF